MQGFRRFADWATLSLDQLLARLRDWFAPLIGTPQEIVAQIQAYAAAGIAEMTLQWFDTDDLAGLDALATEMLPRLAAARR